ncbi:hypothetical protein KY092_17350 [Natronomonas gomsonensis]|uniref:hypothetical protein n=1 Tax=Natronomonas gomsonensis TaxID=1046043 RepID=UPI0020CA838A|nr:hypothetical protein [Natronomonas gomsonensis]MCY4732322.1 hypothetical protein [Natronomonas gomsonensis]
MREANYNSDTASYTERRSAIRQNVSTWNQHQMASSVRNGRLASSEVAAMQNGTRVIQSDTSDFMPGDDDIVAEITGLTLDPLGIEDRTTWIVAPDSKTRNFEMTVERASLQETRQSLLDAIGDLGSEILTGSDEFFVQTNRTTGSNEMWRIYLVNDVDNDSVATVLTEIEGGEENLRAVCSAKGDSVNVRLTEGTLVGDNGEVSCPELKQAFGQERNDIFYVGADEVDGSYQFIVDEERGSFESKVNDEYEDGGLIGSLLSGLGCLLDPDSCEPNIFSSSPSPDDPYTTTAVYDTSVEMTYQTDRMRFTRNLTVAPESSGLP